VNKLDLVIIALCFTQLLLGFWAGGYLARKRASLLQWFWGRDPWDLNTEALKNHNGVYFKHTQSENTNDRPVP
jgi:hypothetical protein